MYPRSTYYLGLHHLDSHHLSPHPQQRCCLAQSPGVGCGLNLGPAPSPQARPSPCEAASPGTSRTLVSCPTSFCLQLKIGKSRGPLRAPGPTPAPTPALCKFCSEIWGWANSTTRADYGISLREAGAPLGVSQGPRVWVRMTSPPSGMGASGSEGIGGPEPDFWRWGRVGTWEPSLVTGV